MNVYALNNIKKQYLNRLVFDKVNLTLKEGRIYALVGENGAGKTTLLDILAMLCTADDGKVFFYGDEVTPKSSLYGFRQKISCLMQNPILFKTSVFNNIAYGLKMRKEKGIDEKVFKISKLLNIYNILDKKPSQISGGEAQKTALARTFIIDTPVILLDEPTANLDDESINNLESLFLDARKSNKTVIFTTHLIDRAYKLSDEVIVIKNKQVFEESYQNFFSGDILVKNGLKVFCINDGVSFLVSTEKNGRGKVSIDPKEIIISNDKFKSSARNCIKGKVTGILDEGVFVKVIADCGVKIISQITHQSLNELDINVGREMFFTFKTASVKVY